MLNVRKTLSKLTGGCLDLIRCRPSTTRIVLPSVEGGERMADRWVHGSDQEPLFTSNLGILPGKVPMITEPAVIMIDNKPHPIMGYNFIKQIEEQSKQVVLPER